MKPNKSEFVAITFLLLTGWNAAPSVAQDSSPPAFTDTKEIRSGVRGDDILRTDQGFLVTGWMPGEVPKPYIAQLDPALDTVLWEKFLPVPSRAILMSMTRDERNRDIYLAGFGYQEDAENYDPLIIRISEGGEEKVRWHPVRGKNLTLWDSHWDARTGDLFVTGETFYHEDNSEMYVARLSPSLEPVWERTYTLESERAASYAFAPIPDGFVLAGGTSQNGEDGTPRYPALVSIDLDGNLIETMMDTEHPETIYHWVRTTDTAILAGGYGTRENREDNDVYFQALDFNLTEQESFYSGWGAADHSVHSVLCGSSLYFGGYTQSFSDTGWRGLIYRQDVQDQTLTETLVSSGNGTVVLRNFGCDENDTAVFVGYRRDGSDNPVELIAGRIPD